MGRSIQVLAIVVMPTAVMAAGAARVMGQTDYFNTDKDRPVRIEDAYATERYAFELQLAPVRLERSRGGIYTWEVAPELTYGMLPRTHVEVGFPLGLQDSGDNSDNAGFAAIQVGVLHNLNTETTALPAFGIATDVLLPIGGALAPDDAYASAKLIMTRTFSIARLHINGQYTFGPELEAGQTLEELSRWLAGIAVDRTLPLRSMLLIADAYLEQPLDDQQDLLWNVGAGVRYQLDPRLAIDAGVGARFGEESSWFLTFGTAYAFAVRSLIPIRR